jgi:hypothetical protein
MVEESSRMFAVRPELMELNWPMDSTVRGRLLQYSLGHALDSMKFAGKTRDEVMAAIESGTFSFLFDDDGKFIEQSMVLDPIAAP